MLLKCALFVFFSLLLLSVLQPLALGTLGYEGSEVGVLLLEGLHFVLALQELLVDPQESILQDEGEHVFELLPVLDFLAVDGPDKGVLAFFRGDHEHAHFPPRLVAAVVQLERETLGKLVGFIFYSWLAFQKVLEHAAVGVFSEVVANTLTNFNEGRFVLSEELFFHGEGVAFDGPRLYLALLRNHQRILAGRRLIAHVPKHFERVQQLELFFLRLLLRGLFLRLHEVLQEILVEQPAVGLVNKLDQFRGEKAQGAFPVLGCQAIALPVLQEGLPADNELGREFWVCTVGDEAGLE
eukprot:CAMPEP_0170498652 /NCGR_PEP_ID=MMETSP0208-20121228/28524_1 /TAXON_ID=197538 /ORGANISM="Strombidium inclinatum, Strain S3" /LENGTH=295 /DNA_ID=CAMNT_0010775897 /DNA_START=1009 /DNA_END=1893 /DNA_ORIENTATION=+